MRLEPMKCILLHFDYFSPVMKFLDLNALKVKNMLLDSAVEKISHFCNSSKYLISLNKKTAINKII